MEDNLTSTRPEEATGLLDVGDLCRMFEESEESTVTARKEAERDRDYVDGRQLTAEEKATLRKRGQPEVIINRIQGKVNFYVGIEKEQRVDPKASPRTPKHESEAQGATDGLRYVADEQVYDHKRSATWRNIIVEGAGGIDVCVEFPRTSQNELMAGSNLSPPKPKNPKICYRRIAWDRMFWDPHSSEADFSDAGYLGVVIWMDYDDALSKYPDGKDALDTTLSTAPSDTYDDKPKFSLWADKKRRRVRICQVYIKRDDQWFFAEFTKGGILKAGPSPYVTDQGESDCPLVFQSANVNRDNERYGVVRVLISPQDEINKRRSKALHLLNTTQIFYEEGTLKDPENTRREAARPDGMVQVAPGALRDGAVKIETRSDLAAGQVQLAQDAKNDIDLMGANAAMAGQRGDGSASGKAIIASQQGGMIEMGDLLDNLRNLDTRVFRKTWYRIRQYWTAEQWISVTDDEQNLQWVGLNVPPEELQMMAMQNPEIAQKIRGTVANVGELDCDIIIEDAPDSVTPALEQWQALVELKKVDAKGELPFRALVQAAPNLKNKGEILKTMEQAGQPNPLAMQAQQIQLAGEAAKIDETKSKTLKNLADAHASAQPEMPEQPAMQQPKGPSESINFKDTPPEAQSQMLAQVGIDIHPAVLAAHAQQQQEQQAALKARQSQPPSQAA
jgi:hypothetical protein